MGPDSGTSENMATFAHQLFFALDVYRERTRRHFGARVGIHCEVLPSDLAEESEVVGIWSSMGKYSFNKEGLLRLTLCAITT